MNHDIYRNIISFKPTKTKGKWGWTSTKGKADTQKHVSKLFATESYETTHIMLIQINNLRKRERTIGIWVLKY